ncbi:MAG: hypothetical protein HBSIN01_26550 [Candidatus Brocadia sinica]|nr:MAG: hypothetical protein BroJett002_04540 [Candidatus Brocadia sinica]GJQ18696.1 MAG: hypothetical protein HBSIN01_26550 [Candidatus Brocadia sinica]
MKKERKKGAFYEAHKQNDEGVDWKSGSTADAQQLGNSGFGNLLD